MSQPIVRTKVIPPRHRSDLVARPRLLNQLEQQLERRLLFVVAPAGYGKTSLLIDLIHQSDLPACWYSLDTLDQNPYRFLAHFIAAIAHKFPAFGAEAHAALQSLVSGQSDSDQLLSILINELYDQVSEEFLLVIDDYHLVSEVDVINNFVNQFVQLMGDNCHLILASRTLLSLPDLALLVARALVGGVGLEDLAFRSDEIQTLLQKNYDLTIDETKAAELVESTEGWITGLLLSTQLMQNGMTRQSSLVRAAGVDLYDYLAQQVLQKQPADLQDFLLRTSLMDELNATRCAQILDPLFGSVAGGWQRLINSLLAQNLFITTVDDDESWVRYHHLFQDFLRQTITQERPDETEKILQRMGTLFTEQEEWEQAHQVYVRLENPQMLADFLEIAGPSLLHHDQTHLLGSWLPEIPEEIIDNRPQLVSLRGCLEVFAGEVNTGLDSFNRAAAALDSAEQPAFLADTLTRRSTAHRLLGDYTTAETDAKQALQILEHMQLPQDENHLLSLRAASYKAMGLSLYMAGQADTGLDWLEKAVSTYETAEDIQRAALAAVDIATMHMNAGRFAKAEHEFQRALKRWRDLRYVTHQAQVLNNLGVLYYLKGDFEQAQIALDEAIFLADKSKHTSMMAFALASMGDLYTSWERMEQACTLYQQAWSLAQQLEDHFLLLYVELAEAHLACIATNWEEAYSHLDAAGRLVVMDVSDYEWGLYQMAMGRFYLAQEHAERAIPPLEDAIQRFQSGHLPMELVQAQLLLAIAHHSAGDWETSLTQLQEAAAHSRELESWQPLVSLGKYFKEVLAAILQRAETQSEPESILLVRAYVRRLLTQISEAIASPERPASASAESAATASASTNSEPAPTAGANDAQPLRTDMVPSADAHQLAPAAAIAEAASQVQIFIRTLGQIEVRFENKPVRSSDWQAQTARDLLLLLIAHPAGLTKEEIGAIFWPEASPDQLKTRFKNTIYRLRKALRPDVVVFEGDVYRFNEALDHIYDVALFLNSVKQARAETEIAKQQQLYQQAVTAYGGEYLPDTDASWVWSERERLQRIYFEISLELGDLYIQTQEYQHALACGERLLAQDSCYEAAHRLMMRAHAATGNRAAVARQFQECERVLQCEIAAPPSEQTIALYNQLMQ